MKTTITARLHRLKRGDFKVLCGRSQCPTVLGIASKPRTKAVTIQDAEIWANRDISGDGVRSAWTLTADRPYLGYFQGADDPEDTYRLIKPETERNRAASRKARGMGRAPLPRGMQTMGQLAAGGKSRAIVGRYPSLPTVVICTCGTPNLVTVPER